MSTIGTLYGRRVRLELTDNDALWVSRAVVGEEGEDATASGTRAITSTLLRRYVMINDDLLRRERTPLWGSIAVLTQRYAIPLHVGEGTPEQQERRARISSLTWPEIPGTVRQYVYATLQGTIPLSAQGAVHWAASYVAQAKMEREPDMERVPVPGASNWFLSIAISRAMTEPHVAGATGSGWATAGLVAAAASGYWWLTRRKRYRRG